MTLAVLCLLLNVFLAAGLGTIVGAASTGERGASQGVAQFLLSILIVGWVWGVVTGVQMIRNASWKRAGAPRSYSTA